MKGQILIFSAAVILLSMIPLRANAQDKYVPKANEELYGTWTNTTASSGSSEQPQKMVNFPDGYKIYENISDSSPYEEGTEQIAEKSTDSEGNVWYKTFGTVIFGNLPSGLFKGYDYKGYKFQCLTKVSKSGTILEATWVQVFGNFDPNLYPAKIDPMGVPYRIFYVAEK